jgi:hypothetical protein
MRAISFYVVVAGLVQVAALQSVAQGADDYFLLKAEAKGRLSVTVDPQSGKVTRATLSSLPKGAKPVWGELGISYGMTLADGKEIHDLAKSLDGQVVLVTGTVEIRNSPPMNRAPDPPHLVFCVQTLKAAPKSK